MAMALMKEIEERRAYRALSDEALPDDQVERLFQAAHLAPSCFNKQGWRFVAVDGEALESLSAVFSEGNRWATRAPLIVAAAQKPSLDCRLDEGRDYAAFDLGLAVMSLVLQATHEGLVAHPIAGYSPSKVRKILGIPEDFVVQTLIVVGKRGADDLLSDAQKEREAGPRQREPLSAVAFRNRWPETS